MPVFDNVQMNNATVLNDMQVNHNQTVMNDLQINGNLTVAGNFQVNGNQTVANSMAAGADVDAAGSVLAAQRLAVDNQPSVPAGSVSVQDIVFYVSGVMNQPGLVLKGTNGVDYVLFIDASGGTPNLAIQPL